eukprot:1582891-Pyramimonas_sp.AAC.1
MDIYVLENKHDDCDHLGPLAKRQHLVQRWMRLPQADRDLYHMRAAEKRRDTALLDFRALEASRPGAGRRCDAAIRREAAQVTFTKILSHPAWKSGRSCAAYGTGIARGGRT